MFFPCAIIFLPRPTTSVKYDITQEIQKYLVFYIYCYIKPRSIKYLYSGNTYTA